VTLTPLPVTLRRWQAIGQPIRRKPRGKNVVHEAHAQSTGLEEAAALHRAMLLLVGWTSREPIRFASPVWAISQMS
jgi:hypothetical protein